MERRHIIITIVFLSGIVAFLLFISYHESTADLEPLSNERMRDISGQSLLEFHEEAGSSAYGNADINFARIEINAQIAAAAEIQDAALGNYGGGTDLDITSLGVKGAPNNANSDAVVQSPYVELAYRNFGDDVDRELVGLRVGAEEIDGAFEFRLDVVSGALKFAGPYGTAPEVSGDRQTQACVNVVIEYCTGFDLADGISANGTSDFWLSINKESIFYEHQNPYITNQGRNTGNESFHTDQQGFWLHLTDSTEAEGVF